MSDHPPASGGKRGPIIIPTHPPAHDEGGEGNWLVSYADMMTLLVGFFVILLSFSTVDQEKLEDVKRELTKEFGGKYQIPFADVAERIREALKKVGLGEQFVIKQNDAGLEISFSGAVFFRTGSADLSTESRGVLNKLVEVIKTESAAFNIVVEGYTDDTPVGAGLFVKNNWELSSIRACRVLEAFSDIGLPKERLTAIGYGETKPIVPNRDAEGNSIERNQSQNRRVVIKLMKQTKASL